MKSDQSYFGGEASDLGHVHALQPRNFHELVMLQLSMATPLNVTREQFFKLDKKQRDKTKRTAYLIPAFMKKRNSQRLLENAAGVRLLFLDIDDPKEARPYYESPESLDKALHPFSFALYTTANSTPSSPRLRVVVDASLDDPEDYKQAVETVGAMIGLPGVTTESKVVVQAMYLPVVFKGEDKDFDHPLLHYRTDGRKFRDKDINPDLDELIGLPTGKRGKDQDKPTDTNLIDALEYLRSPVEGMDISAAAELLKFLDPDMPYHDWLNVCFALKHQFGQTEDADLALDLFDEWSGKGEKYAGAKDVRAKWKSARTDTTTRVPVTMRSLIRKAASEGWKDKRIQTAEYNAIKQWIKEEQDSMKLMNEGVRRIAMASSMDANHINEEHLLVMLHDRLKQLGVKLGLPVIRTSLRKLKKVTEALMKEKTEEVHPKWTRGFCHVGSTNEFYRHTTGAKYVESSLNAQFEHHLLEKIDDDGDDITLGSKPIVKPRDYLLNNIKVPKVWDYAYDPRKPNDRIFEKGGEDYINTYIQTHPEPDFNKAPAAGKLFMAHLKNLILEPEYIRILMDFLAYQVQFPGHKVRWAVLMQGAQGCGKTFLLEALAAVLGRQHVKSVGAEVLFSSGFNDWAIGAQVVGLEEIRVVGQNRHEVMNKLKPCITNTRISINKKFVDVTEHDNVTNYLAFTNHRDSLAVTEGDRRYFVLRSRMQTKEQVRELGDKYFSKLFKMLNRDADGLRAWFEAWEISEDFNPDGHAPWTKYLDELVEASASEDVTTIRQAIGDSKHPLVSSTIVNSTILLQMLEIEGHRDMKGQRLAAILRDEGYESIGRKFVHDSRQTIWVKPGEMSRQREIWDFARDFLSGKISQEEVDILGF